MTSCLSELNLTGARIRKNLSSPELIEAALRRNEGRLAGNGALVVNTGQYTGRCPKDKFLEDTPEIHDKIWWGKVNMPMTSAQFDEAEKLAVRHINSRDEVFVFEGFVGADPSHRLSVTTVCDQAWHALFTQTLFLCPTPDDLKRFDSDWTVINCGTHKLTKAEQERVGARSEVLIAQSMTRKTVVIFGTEYGGENKKSLFYAMNFDMPEEGVCPMHCSANVDHDDPSNVALFFGLSGTGKTTLSADPSRDLIGDDEHGWSDTGVFNFEGGCYAKCIHLSREGEPLIWDAIKFGSVLENVVVDEHTRVPDYDDGSMTENTRATYPVEHIPNARIPSMGGHPKNVVFLTADAFGVLPPVSKLTREQAMYYFINGYTSKLAGTEAGVTEPVPNFSPCFGGPFMPRQPQEYADMLAERIDKHGADVWLLNTGWSGGPYGVGARFSLKYTRAMVDAILDGTLKNATYTEDPVFGLRIPGKVEGVPAEVLHPRNTWKDKAAYDKQATDLAKRFRANDANFDIDDKVRAAGPRG
ncbi:MAG: phosphoenolpyruvate carboxykinase (ATP) [Phycisphaeraceae bacterium]|nr:phosphoenolpyruvate carboxykinase (ATP) [Phycisphaeraceae bacterium]